MGIGRQVKPDRPLLQTCQDKLLDGVEADRAKPDGIRCRRHDGGLWERFHQPQHLDELSLAAPAHARLEQPM